MESQRILNRQANSLFLTIENSALKTTDVFNRALFKQQWKEQDDKHIFTIPAVNTDLDRKVLFHLVCLSSPYTLFNPASYEKVLEYVAVLDKQNTFGFNTILALYNEVDNSTVFGFSPIHKNIIAINVKNKLLVSPLLPYHVKT